MAGEATITTLGDEECWEVLGTRSIGRLATAVGGEPEIFPVSFGVAERRLYFVTMPGTKLVELVVNSRVAFESDEHTEQTATSIVVKGVAELLDTDADIAEAEATGVRPFADSGQSIWVRITPTQVSGRRLTR
ncbi:pyridoxamine 5'-phosphate oxidase family protein [Isoptericola jiangsuensis]|uniref:pyridoxamine 5'-phosphate oxidase family protein n=1 Tax=Isoptericola jiangsuensis TaxID=548579 RepID=UPI003AB0E7A9